MKWTELNFGTKFLRIKFKLFEVSDTGKVSHKMGIFGPGHHGRSLDFFFGGGGGGTIFQTFSKNSQKILGKFLNIF